MKIKIPQSTENTNVHSTIDIENALVIVGKNGSGKSRFVREIEKLNPTCHRISAQKSLKIPDTIPLKSEDTANEEFLFGSAENKTQSAEWRKRNYRWRNGEDITNDYQQVLSLLFMKENERNADYVEQMKSSSKKLDIPSSEVDIIRDIWMKVFPQRSISLVAASVKASLDNQSYAGNEMSDGERAGLYLMAECLCVPPNYIVIIDEPENHFHRSIFCKLWNEIEQARPDCIFIYVTHDLEFATSRNNAKLLCMNKFDGKNWIYHTLDSQEKIPLDIVKEILGGASKILFIEGTGTSYDQKLYETIFPDIKIISCGGCAEVIRCVKAQKKYKDISHICAYGLIDRDFRPNREIEALAKEDIFVVELAEIESFFIVPEVLKLVLERLGSVSPDNIEVRLGELIQRITDIYKGQLEKQINAAVQSELIFQLTEKIKKNTEYFLQHDKNEIEELVNEIKKEISEKFQKANNDYVEILRIFNFKATMGETEITNSLSSLLGITGNYEERVINFLHDKEFKKQASAIWKSYIPAELIPKIEE